MTVASGTQTARIATDQASAMMTGFCIDHDRLPSDGFGSPHSNRTAAVTALDAQVIVTATDVETIDRSPLATLPRAEVNQGRIESSATVA